MIDPGWTPCESFNQKLQEILRLPDHGYETSFFVVTSGSASSMAKLTLSGDANGGYFRSEADKGDARKPEQEKWADFAVPEVLAGVSGVVPVVGSPDSGTYFAGALDQAFDAIDSGSRSAEVLLISGGGVHRDASFDLLTADPALFSEWQPDISSSVPLTVELIGTASFNGIDRPPDPKSAANVETFWENRCNGVVQAGHSCSRTNGA